MEPHDMMEPQDMDAPLIEGLDGLPAESFSSPVCRPEFRSRIWEQTARAVQARPHRRRVLILGSLCIAYLAGLTTTYLLGGLGPTAGQPGQGTAAPERTSGGPSRLEGSGLLAALPSDPARLEDEFLGKSASERKQLLKTAGDLYLSERLDVGSALHCYRELLNSESPDVPKARDFGESWLLSVLRHARQKEVNREDADN